MKSADRLPFISSYCDRWCERCACTSRCAAFAADMAIGMSGDVQEGLQLALGAPHPEGDALPPAPPDWLGDVETIGATAGEWAAFGLEEEQRNARIGDTSIMKLASACAELALRWLVACPEHILAGADVMLREALTIAGHDATLVTAKLARALDGQDRHEHDGDGEDHPIQNDWNGSAKVGLISLERSEAAWRVIAQLTGEQTPALLATLLRDLRHEVEHVFPNAALLVRPGFDESAR